MSTGFPCPYCGEWLAVSAGYPLTVWAVSFLTSACLAYALGFRNLAFLVIAILASLPLWVIGQGVVALTQPPRLERRPKT